MLQTLIIQYQAHLANYTAIAIDNAAVYQKLEDQSVTDHLTGLKNRRYFEERIEYDVAQTIRDYKDCSKNKNTIQPENSDLIFFMVDLDYFKDVNDQYGHNAGDSVLIQIKTILEEVFRETDYLIRWGGEEFLIVAKQPHSNYAPLLAERLRVRVESHSFHIHQELALRKTCSIGFATFPFYMNKTKSLSWEQVIKVADTCLYAAKNSQRNAWVGLTESKASQPKSYAFPASKVIQQLVEQNEIIVQSSFEDRHNIDWEKV